MSLAAARKGLDNASGQPGRSTLTKPGRSNSYAISHLTKEFENQSQNFDNEALAIVEVNSESKNPDEEFRALKHKFDSWEKDYKARLRDTRAKLQKQQEAERHHHHHNHHHHKWWWLLRNLKFK